MQSSGRPKEVGLRSGRRRRTAASALVAKASARSLTDGIRLSCGTLPTHVRLLDSSTKVSAVGSCLTQVAARQGHLGSNATHRVWLSLWMLQRKHLAR